MSTETEKLDIAIEYLDTASALRIHEISYFSAMHLAAAAEEIAGKACRIAGISPVGWGELVEPQHSLPPTNTALRTSLRVARATLTSYDW